MLNFNHGDSDKCAKTVNRMLHNCNKVTKNLFVNYNRADNNVLSIFREFTRSANFNFNLYAADIAHQMTIIDSCTKEHVFVQNIFGYSIF